MYQLRKQAQEMQSRLVGEKVTGISRDKTLEITINGNQEITDINILDRDSFVAGYIEDSIKEAFADAQGKIKNIMMEKFKDMLT